MPDLRAREGTRLITLQYPATGDLIIVMDQESKYLAHGLEPGEVGVLPKQYPPEQLWRAFIAVRREKIYVPSPAPETNSLGRSESTAFGPCRFPRVNL